MKCPIKIALIGLLLSTISKGPGDGRHENGKWGLEREGR
jgi:hypothetical protein